MADSKFERFKKMYPGGTKDMNIMAIPAPLPGPGGIGRAVVGRAVQSGIRRFSDVGKADKTTKMKDAKGLERKDPMEFRVVESGRSKALEKTRQGGGGPTKMKDTKGLERKPERKASPPGGMGRKVLIGGAAAGGAGYMAAKEMAKQRAAKASVGQDKVESNQSVQRSSYNQNNPTQRPYDASTSPKAPPKPKLRPAREGKRAKVERKVERKAERKAKPKLNFKANWKGAAPTKMQRKASMR